MGKVKDKYIKYEAAGDQRVGRTVAGLDVNSIEFGVSPPIYIVLKDSNGNVTSSRSRQADLSKQNDCQLLFPRVPSIWRGIIVHLVASLIYNRENSKNKMPLGNSVTPVLEAQLPSNPRVVKVDVLYPYNNVAEDGSRLVDLTGLPNSTIIFNQIIKLQLAQDDIGEKLDELPNAVATKIQTLLNGRGIGGGTISMDDLHGSIRGELQNLPLFRDLQDVLNHLGQEGSAAGRGGGPGEESDPSAGAASEEGYEWPSHPSFPNIPKKKLPESFDLRRYQSTTPQLIWQAWHHGLYTERWGWKVAAFPDVPRHMWEFTQEELQQKNISKEEALRKRTSSDRQLFLKMRWLCLKLDAAVGVNTDAETPTKQQPTQYYGTEAIQNLLPPNITPAGRKRRRAEMSWVSVADFLRKKEREQRKQQQQQQQQVHV